MDFDKSKVYTALNADELKAGSIVCVADSLSNLKSRFYRGKTGTLSQINSEDSQYRFRFETCDFALAYLIEPPKEHRAVCVDDLNMLGNILDQIGEKALITTSLALCFSRKNNITLDDEVSEIVNKFLAKWNKED